MPSSGVSASSPKYAVSRPVEKAVPPSLAFRSVTDAAKRTPSSTDRLNLVYP